MRALPPTSYLHECLSYDPATGVLVWRHRPTDHFSSVGRCKRWNEDYAGEVAGTDQNNGYRQISIDDRLFLSHRVIWKMMTGEDPPITIDHDDNDGRNNRWGNLRIATHTDQNWNHDIQSNNTTGRRGVSKSRSGKYRAYINIIGKQKLLGIFDTVNEAGDAHDAVAKEVAGEFYWKG